LASGRQHLELSRNAACLCNSQCRLHEYSGPVYDYILKFDCELGIYVPGRNSDSE
jgi:hypothetical protein